MSRIDKLSAELALLPPDQFISAFQAEITRERKALIAMGLDKESAQIAAQSIVAAAVMRAKKLEEGSLVDLKINLASLGVMLN